MALSIYVWRQQEDEEKKVALVWHWNYAKLRSRKIYWQAVATRKESLLLLIYSICAFCLSLSLSLFFGCWLFHISSLITAHFVLYDATCLQMQPANVFTFTLALFMNLNAQYFGSYLSVSSGQSWSALDGQL